MQIWLNDEPREIAVDSSVTELLALLNAKPDGVALALNGNVVAKRLWPDTVLKADDKVVLFNVVAGG